MSDDFDDLQEFLGMMGSDEVASPEREPEKKTPPPATSTSFPDFGTDDDGLDDVLDGMVEHENQFDLTKPWMSEIGLDRFHLVRTEAEFNAIVDKIIELGEGALDLETEGFDNRIDYDEDGRPSTKHKIVGVCLGADGHGYYAPLRHKFEAVYGEKDPNLNIAQVEEALRRLCWASQPKIQEDAYQEDPVWSTKTDKTHQHIKLFFWNAKFDQEFLYPVTGIDIWHPESFEDGLLAAYVIYTDDDLSLKENSERRLYVEAGKEKHPCEMIHFKDLFPPGTKKNDRRFYDLYPDVGPDGKPNSVVLYGCSDGICTWLLCTDTKNLPSKVKRVVSPSTPWITKDEFSDFVLLARKGLRYAFTYRLEKQTAQTVRIMERSRTRIDIEEVKKIAAEAEVEQASYLEQIQSMAAERGFPNFNPGSPEQLSKFLFEPSGLDLVPKPGKTEGEDQYKTDGDTLEKLSATLGDDAPPILDWVVKYRQIDKQIGTYLRGMIQSCDENGCLRFNFRQDGAISGRFTAPKGKEGHGYAQVPIHGIPAKHDPKRPACANSLRRAFIPHDGYVLVKVDYAGQELRVVANISEENLWINEFLEGDGDLHTLTAIAFFPGLTKADPMFKDKRKAGKCVHPDSLVFSNGQLKPLIETFDFPSEPDTFLDLPGSSVFNGTCAAGVHQSYFGGESDLVHVVTSGSILTCTPRHQFKLRDGRFVPAGSLEKGFELELCSSPELSLSPPPKLELDLWPGMPTTTYQTKSVLVCTDIAYFAGAFAGDGTGNDSYVAITHGCRGDVDAYGNPFDDWVDSLVRSCCVCGFDPRPNDKRSPYLDSSALVRFFRTIGISRKRQKRLRVPSWVMSSRDLALHYLAGLFDTDGTISVKGGLDWTTKSAVFAGQVATLMRCVGLDFNVGVTYNKTYRRHYYRLRLTVVSSWSMKPYLRHRGKANLLHAPEKVSHTKDQLLVVQVIPAKRGACLDISMAADPHVYWVNGLVTHNTANFALVYGGGVRAIQRAVKCDEMEAARKLQAFHKSVPSFAAWTNGQHAFVKKNLGVVTGFRRWIAIPDARAKAGDVYYVKGEKMSRTKKDAKKIVAACERKASNLPIQGSGSDILKISLVRLVREFIKRRWLRNGGDDRVRMVMTVHDEIVFEIKKEHVMEVMPVIIEQMESPSNAASKKWAVPLVVEPLIGTNWELGSSDGSDDWLKIIKGKVPIPPCLEGCVVPRSKPSSTTAKPLPAQVIPEQPVLKALVQPSPEPITQGFESESPRQDGSFSELPSIPDNIEPLPPPPKGVSVVVFRLSVQGMTLEGIKSVLRAILVCAPYLDSFDKKANGPVLHLMNCEDKTLIGPEERVYISPQRFQDELQRVNLPSEYELQVTG